MSLPDSKLLHILIRDTTKSSNQAKYDQDMIDLANFLKFLNKKSTTKISENIINFENDTNILEEPVPTAFIQFLVIIIVIIALFFVCKYNYFLIWLKNVFYPESSQKEIKFSNYKFDVNSNRKQIYSEF
jgi:hypothetical protein